MIPLALAGGLIVLAGLAAYSNSFHGPFIFDDNDSIPHNSTIRHLWPIGPALSPPCNGETVSGRPILNLSFAINYALSGTNVWGYHLTNLAIHLLNGLLLFGILRRTFLLPPLRPTFGRNSLPLASAIALLWVVHPLQTESVTYLVQRAESLAAMFYLLVMYAVIRGVQQSSRPTMWYIVAVVACWLGVATKEVVATAPVMVLLYDRAFLAGTFRQAWRQRWGLYLGLAVGWILLIGLMFQRGFVTTTLFKSDWADEWNYARSHQEMIWAYARSQPGVILYYLRQVVWPHPLCLDWNWPVAETVRAIYGPMLAVGLLLVATIWGLCRSGSLAWGLLGAWFFLVLAPSSSIAPLDQLACEHRMYLPLGAVITLLMISAYLAGQKWIVRGRLAIGLCLVILIAVALGFLTFGRNKDYRSVLSVWEDTAMKAFDSASAHNDWGNALLEQGQALKAIEHYEQAIRLKPNHARAHYNWGIALSTLGRPLEAIEHFQQALRSKPTYADANSNWGKALLDLGHPEEAIKHFEQALQQKPSHFEAQNDWGLALVTLGQPKEAVKHFEQAVKLNPEYGRAHNNLGLNLAELGRWSEAIEQYQQALQVNPDHALPHFNLALALLHVGRLEEAIEHGLEAARRMPDNPQINRRVAWLLATHEATKKDNGQEAVKLALRACELTQRKDVNCLDTLAAAYASAGRFDEAVTTAKEAWQLAQATGQSLQAEEIHMRLQLYRDQKPMRSGQ